VRALSLTDPDGTVRRSTLVLSDQPEYEQVMLDALPLPNRWATLDTINAGLCELVREQELLLVRGQAPALSESVLAALGLAPGVPPVSLEELGLEVARIPVAELRDDIRVVLDLGPRRADGSRALTRELRLGANGAPRDRDDALLRQAARLLWYDLGGHALVGAEVVSDPQEFVARLQHDRIHAVRRYRSTPEMRRLLAAAGDDEWPAGHHAPPAAGG
jgi:hypothetical protein